MNRYTDFEGQEMLRRCQQAREDPTGKWLGVIKVAIALTAAAIVLCILFDK